MTVLKNRLLIFFFLGLCLFSGCRILPWWGEFGDSSGDALPGRTIFSRNVSTLEEIDLDTAEFKLRIPAGAIKTDSALTVSAVEPSLSGLSWPSEFKPISEIFSIRLLPESPTLKFPASITFALPSRTPSGKYFVMRRSSDGKISLHERINSSGSAGFEISTMGLSSWVLVEQRETIAAQLKQAPVVTTSFALPMPKSGKYQSDLIINSMVPSDNPDFREKGSLKLELSSFENFRISVTTPSSGIAGTEFISTSDNKASIDLFNPTFSSVETVSGISTFSTMIRLKDVAVEEIPDFFAIKTSYVTPSGISYDGYSSIIFTRPPDAEPPALLTVSPPNGATGVDPDTDIIMEFKTPLNRQAFKDSLSFEPEITVSPDSFQWNSDDTQVRFSFSQKLAENTDYAIRIATTLEDIYGNKLIQPLISRFSTGDGKAPEITDFYPPAGTQLAVNGAVRIKFNKAVASNTASISFTPPPANGFNAAWSEDEVEIFPLPEWADNNQIELVIAAGLADLNGKRTSQNLTRTFSTGSFKLAQVTSTNPVNNSFELPVSSTVTISFDQPMKQVETEAALVFSSGFPTGKIFNWNAESTVLTISFEPRLKFSTSHSIEIKETAESQSGSRLNGVFRLNFTTVSGIEPAIASSIPANNAEIVNLKIRPDITFSSPMDIQSVNSAVTLKDGLGNDVLISFSWSGQTGLKITPALDLQPSSQYTISIADSAKDSNGYRLFEPLNISFETAANYPAELLSTDPVNNALNVSYNRSVRLVFSQSISKDSFAFNIEPQTTGGYQVNWSNSDKEASIEFNGGFASNTQYRLKILETTKDSGGQPVGSIPDLVFTSESYDAPRITEILPASGSISVPANSNFQIVFDTAMNQSITNAAISFEPAVSGLVFNWSDGDRRLSIGRSSNLAYNTQYYLNIAETAQRSDGEKLLNSYRASYKTLPQTFVNSVVPANGSSNISAYSQIEINLSQDFNLNELQNFTKIKNGAEILAGVFAKTDKKLLFTSSSPLPLGTTIQIEILSGATDINGLPVIPFNSSFSVENIDTTVPEIISSQPAAGALEVPLNQTFSVSFNKPMNTSSVTQAYSMTPTPPGNRTFNWSDSNKTLTITYSEPLNHSTSYQLRIVSSASDPTGRTMAGDYLLSFKSVARPEIVLSKRFPQPFAIGIQLRPEILIEFTKAMNKAATQSAFSLKAGATAISGVFSWTADNIMKFIPSADLSSGVSHTITVNSSARDTSGNYIEGTLAWSFTTASEEGKIWSIKRAQTDSADLFSKRQDHVSISFNSKLWVIGGYDGEYLNDVWSSPDGISWTREVASGTAGMFAGRAGHACAVFSGKIWLSGGYSDQDGLENYFSDVWSSSDGRNWVQVTGSGNYFRRAWHSMQVFANKLWVLGGESYDDGLNQAVILDDSWSSSDGINWSERSSVTAFFPRKRLMSAVIGEKLWVWGGYGQNQFGTIAALNDIWTTTNGDFWSLISANGPFTGRCGAGVTTHNNRVWLAGGSTLPTGGTKLNDVWASGDGSNWTQILSNSAGSSQQFSPRSFFGLSSLSGKLFITGGVSGTGMLNEVWASQ